jgi:hypothetical protein
MKTLNKKLSPSDLLAAQFLEKAKEFNSSIELIKGTRVVKSFFLTISHINLHL